MRIAPARWLLRVVLVAACAVPGWAPQAAEPAPVRQAEAQRIAWSQLADAERALFAPLATQWDTLAPRQQQRLRQLAQRWRDAGPVRRAAIEQRIARWARMDPQQRADVARRYADFQRMSPEQQDGVREAFRRFQSLPPEERATLRGRYRAMTPAERDAFVAGAAAERRNGAWKRLLADVPPEQRPAQRAMWLAFTPAERRALRQYARSLPQADRAVLRDRLLGMSEAQRRDYIATLPQPKP